MSIFVANTSLSKSWLFLVNRVNEVAAALANVVSVNSNTATGNASINGTLTVTTFVTDTISGANGTLIIDTDVDLNGHQFVGNTSFVNSTLYGNTAITGPLTVSNTVSVTKSSTFSANVEVTATVNAATSKANNLIVAQTSTLNGSTTANGTFVANGTSTLLGNTSITGNVSLGGSVVVPGNVTVTGTIVVPVQANNANDATAASTSFVINTLTNTFSAYDASLIAGAPGNLNTFAELAVAIGNDTTFSTTMSTALGKRLRVDAAQSFSNTQLVQGRSNLGVRALSDPAAMVKLTSGNSTNFGYLQLSLASYIAAGYRVFRLHLHNYRPAVDGAAMMMKVSNNNGSSFTDSGYQYGYVYAGNNTVDGVGTESSTTDKFPISTLLSNGTPSSLWLDMYIGGYFDCSWQSQSFFYYGFGSGLQIGAGTASLANVNAIRFETYNGNIATAQWDLYGVS